MTISHIGINVAPGTLDMMIDWYVAVLTPLGYKLKVDLRPAYPVVGLGAQYADLWLTELKEAKQNAPDDKLHLAFMASNRQQVRDFHAEAMKIGAKDNGGPGLRPHYASTYYGAFVYDPEGRNVETHVMTPAFMSEPQQWNLTLAAVGTTVALGLGFLANYTGYLSQFM
ncbi:hypothetical protein M408DRAFT_326038 [Serendipita vermifera MAFF 305830]|uniref:VOC domain-containing protein n=1 Tax=Serendipita vermifera MAFF 305830 TaxID=933852 RepID=A0A0C3B8W8_SERVB|nr:hypothetical protein M408DRAFT_326038 [Serendipita vermifera MAFF 305830]